MNAIDELMRSPKLAELLDPMWAAALVARRSEHPIERNFDRAILKNQYLTQIRDRLRTLSRLPIAFTCEDVLDAVYAATEHYTSASVNLGAIAEVLVGQIDKVRTWEPFPMASIVDWEDYSECVGDVFWRSASGDIRTEIASTGGQVMFGRVVARATERALALITTDAENAIQTAIRNLDIVGWFHEPMIIDRGTGPGLTDYLIGLPFVHFDSPGSWGDIRSWVADVCTIALDTSDRGASVLQRIGRSLRFLMASDSQRQDGPGMFLAFAAFEALIRNHHRNPHEEFADLAKRAAVLLEPEVQRWPDASKALERLWKGRNEFAHGQYFEPKELEWTRFQMRAVAGELLQPIHEYAGENSDAFRDKLDRCRACKKPFRTDPSQSTRLWRGP